jgi:MYXO-CTERM domain-containing protein
VNSLRFLTCRALAGFALLSLTMVGRGAEVRADTHTFGTSTQGWWSTTYGSNGGGGNYIVGSYGGGEFRDFFSFDLSALDLTGKQVVSAKLEVWNTADRQGALNPEMLGLFDVSTSVAALTTPGPLNPTIFSDLGSGTSYGNFPVYGPGNNLVSFDLNAAALADIHAAAGSTFSIGGALQDLTGAQPQFIFGSSWNDGRERLILETAPSAAATPEPASMALLGLGALPLLRRRLRRQPPTEATA